MLKIDETFMYQELLENDGELLPNCHGTATTTYGDCQPNNDSTVKEFRDCHGLTTSEFTSLRRKAERRNPGKTFTYKDAEGVVRVQNTEILETLIDKKPEKPPETALAIYEPEYYLPDLAEFVPDEVLEVSTDKLYDFVDTIQERLNQEAEAAKIQRLIEVGNAAKEQKAQEDLVAMLVMKGYSVTEAAKIALGAKKNA